MKTVYLLAPAKLNLTLYITGQREDEYHLIESVMQSISIYDGVRITLEEGEGISLSSNLPEIPLGPTNTAYKAILRFFECVNLPIRDKIHVHLEKGIPTMAGLGGGSSDAAAVLIGLNELYKTGVSKSKLAQIGEKVGADVPFCVTGGTAFVTGIGEEIESLSPPKSGYIVVAMPDAKVSTAEAYGAFDETGKYDEKNNLSMKKALQMGNAQNIAENLHNSLQNSSVPNEVFELLDVFRLGGALGAQMTGSGAACFGIFESLEKAKHCAKILEKDYSFVKMCESVSEGPKII